MIARTNVRKKAQWLPLARSIYRIQLKEDNRATLKRTTSLHLLWSQKWFSLKHECIIHYIYASMSNYWLLNSTYVHWYVTNVCIKTQHTCIDGYVCMAYVCDFSLLVLLFPNAIFTCVCSAMIHNELNTFNPSWNMQSFINNAD